ncbi:7tm 6 domain containing protein, partial [Asbolus verrucosus]
MERFDWKFVIKFNIFSLWIIGLWPSDNEYKFTFYTLYAVISIGVFINGLGILITISIFMVNVDSEDLEEVIMYFVEEILVNIKVIMLIKNMRLLKQIMTTLNSDVFQPKNFRQRQLIAPALDFWKMVYNVFTAAGGPTVVLWLIAPLLIRTKEFQLPFKIWYPYNTKVSPLYEITYCHQTLAYVYTAISVYNADMLIAALMVFIGAQCDILSDDLRNLRDNTVVSFNKKLRNCIRHHQLILTYIVTITFYLIQISTYCWFGNEAKVKSNQISHAVFESDWIHQPLERKKNILMIIIRSQKPIRLSAFNLFYLSLDIYIQ